MLLESSELLKLSVMLDSYFSSAKGTQLDKAVRSGQAIGMIYFDRFLRNGTVYILFLLCI